MRLRRLLWLLVLSALSFLIVSRGACINASADVVYRQMTVDEAYDFYGSSIDCVYYSTTGYKHVSLVPSSNRYSYHLQSNPQFYGSDVPSWVKTSDLNYVVYYAIVTDYSSNPSYLGVSIDPNVHFTDCNALRFCAASYLGSYTSSSQAYDESFIRIFGQTELRYTNTPYIYDNVFPYMSILRGSNSAFRVLPVWADYSSDTLSTVSMLQVGFNGVHLDGNEIDVYLSCPLINDSAVGGTGIVTGTNAPTTGTNVNVNVDLTETNGLLETIISGLSSLGSSIVNGLQNLFLPSADDLTNWKNTIAGILNETFGGIPALETQLQQTMSSLFQVSASESLTFPEMTIPKSDGSTWQLSPAKTVQLKPAQNKLGTFYSWVEGIINVVATIAVINTCINMTRRILIGEVVVDAD